MQDSINAYNNLSNLLRGIKSEKQMMDILYKNKKQINWIGEVIEQLEYNESLKTQFFTAFNKNFQPYSIHLQKFKDGVFEFKTKILNKISGNLSYREFLTNLKQGVEPISKESIYKRSDNKNVIIPSNVTALKNKINSQLSTDKNNVFTKTNFHTASTIEKTRIFQLVY